MSEWSSMDGPDGLDVISEVAAKRREAASVTLSRAAPDFVLSIEMSELTYNLPRKLLPFTQIDLPKLQATLREGYGLTMRPPDFGLLLSEMPREELANMPVDQAAQRVLKFEDASLSFESGRYPISKYEFSPISSVLINNEYILVSVQAVGKVAELLCAEVFEAIWDSAGVPKRWEEVADKVMLMGQTTATKVDLGLPLMQMLNPSLTTYFDQQVVAGRKYGNEMGLQSAVNGLRPADGTVSVVALEDLSLQVSRFDVRTGTHSQNKVRFLVSAKSEMGTSICVIQTALKYESHIEFIAELIDAVKGSNSD